MYLEICVCLHLSVDAPDKMRVCVCVFSFFFAVHRTRRKLLEAMSPASPLDQLGQLVSWPKAYTI